MGHLNPRFALHDKAPLTRTPGNTRPSSPAHQPPTVSLASTDLATKSILKPPPEKRAPNRQGTPTEIRNVSFVEDALLRAQLIGIILAPLSPEQIRSMPPSLLDTIIDKVVYPPSSMRSTSARIDMTRSSQAPWSTSQRTDTWQPQTSMASHLTRAHQKSPPGPSARSFQTVSATSVSSAPHWKGPRQPPPQVNRMIMSRPSPICLPLEGS